MHTAGTSDCAINKTTATRGKPERERIHPRLCAEASLRQSQLPRPRALICSCLLVPDWRITSSEGSLPYTASAMLAPVDNSLPTTYSAPSRSVFSPLPDNLLPRAKEARENPPDVVMSQLS